MSEVERTEKKKMTTYSLCSSGRCDSQMKRTHRLYSCIGPYTQRYCCRRYGAYSDGSSFGVRTSWSHSACQPIRYARNERSMSSTSVSSFQPPLESMHAFRQRPPEPLNCRKVRHADRVYCSPLMCWLRVISTHRVNVDSSWLM